MNSKIMKTMIAFMFTTLLLFGCTNKEEPEPPTNPVPPTNDTINDEDVDVPDEGLPDEDIDVEDRDRIEDEDEER